MEVKKGQFAKIDITVEGTQVTVMKLRNWSYSTSVEELETTAAGDEWKTVEGGIKSWEGDAEINDVDTFYLDYLEDKAVVNYGAATDTIYEQGTALISGVEKNASYNDLIQQSISFVGDGALTKETTL